MLGSLDESPERDARELELSARWALPTSSHVVMARPRSARFSVGCASSANGSGIHRGSSRPS